MKNRRPSKHSQQKSKALKQKLKQQKSQTLAEALVEDPFKKGRPSQKPLSLAEKLSLQLEKTKLEEEHQKELQQKKLAEQEMEKHQQKTKEQLLHSLSKRAAEEYHQEENSLGMKILKVKAWLQKMIHLVKQKLKSFLKK